MFCYERIHNSKEENVLDRINREKCCSIRSNRTILLDQDSKFIFRPSCFKINMKHPGLRLLQVKVTHSNKYHPNRFQITYLGDSLAIDANLAIVAFNRHFCNIRSTRAKRRVKYFVFNPRVQVSHQTILTTLLWACYLGVNLGVNTNPGWR